MPCRPAAPRSLTIFLAAALALLAIALTAPALASAATYTVNTTVDEEKGLGFNCGALETCPLRAAIELSNESTSVRDTIKFSAAFDGEVATDTIHQFLVNFPAVADDVTIEGGQCETDAGEEGPCVGLEGSKGLEVLADDVTIEGLAITDAQTAIRVVEVDGFTARGDWIGVPLDGGTTANNLDGIVLEPGSDEATIGGTTAAARNVFAYNNGRALALVGASKATVEGNYFGVAPDGTTVGENEVDLVVSSHVSGGPPVTVPAAENTIGADVGATGIATDACDFGCNVFASSFFPDAGIDLLGLGGPDETSAGGGNEIEGNFVGLDAAGGALANAANVGIRVGTAPETTLGGPSPGQANHIVGSGFAIKAGNGGLPAKKLVVEGNSIGRSPDGTDELSPPFMGMEIASDGIVSAGDQAKLVDNSISATDTGILQHGTGAVIEGNEINGGEIGIETLSSTAGIGNQVKGNHVTDTEEEGILIRNALNKVTGNQVTGAEEAGIAISAESATNLSNNLIGGDLPADENAIFDSGGPAIEIRTSEGSRNEIGRNHGNGNGGAFITLRPFNGPENDPNGAKRPTIVSAGKTEASGKAPAEALVRVFRKTSAEEGELAGFLGEAKANSSGEWNVNYGALPEGALVTATETNAEHGTSDLANTATTPPDPPTPTCATDALLCPPSTGSAGSSSQAPIVSPPPAPTPLKC